MRYCVRIFSEDNNGLVKEYRNWFDSLKEAFHHLKVASLMVWVYEVQLHDTDNKKMILRVYDKRRDFDEEY